MRDAGEHVGWVARQVGHSSFKMTYEHYYSHITNYQADDGAKFMERVYGTKKKASEKYGATNVAAPEAQSANILQALLAGIELIAGGQISG